MRSTRVPLFDLKQVESLTKLVKVKVSFRSDKSLDEPEVDLQVFIFKSLAKSKLSYLFNTLFRVTEFPQKTQKFAGR